MKIERSTRLVILDRDGVVNEDSDCYIKKPNEWAPIPGALEAIKLLSDKGFTVVIATNQAGVAKGVLSSKDLTAIHEKLMSHVAYAGGRIDRIYLCTHHPNDMCSCRKPKPGMLIEACETYNTIPSAVPFVGDSLRDIEAALSAGCQPILVLTGNGQVTRSLINLRDDVQIFEDLLDFTKTYIERSI